MTSEIKLPSELEDAVRTSAANAPALVPDRTAVYARARKIRRRTAAVRALAAGVVALALGASYPLVHARLAPEITDGGLTGGQPIGLWQNRDAPPLTAGGQSGVHVPGSGGEIAAQLRTVDGRNVIVPVSDPQPGLSQGSYLGPAPLDGGGLATIGYAPSGRKNSIGKLTVVVLDAAGRTVASRPAPDIRSEMPRPMPMTGNATTLFWWAFEQAGKPGQERFWPVLNRYDIRTGRLAERAPAVGGNGYQLPYFGMQATAARIISWPAVGGQTCSADIADAGTGERVSVLRPVIEDCSDVYFALSPDNQQVAALVTYRTPSTWTQRVLVLDAHTGRIRKEVQTPALAAGADRSQLVSGLDWLGHKTIRYARGSLAGGNPILLRIRP
ncbi:hypothetical protein ACIBSW_31670 [Actinoplanes sp. NPDC049668]|uniref:hypothetical protein n=1 Tax=unclassified Actinoplanes TaxID=2626549 RepID=UPI0033B11542